ncbi:MAG: hypothetical protein J0I06_22250 [Planctomycetes bacterium]|nr:hypothetical protein [Planctomycetota bacterium]
MRDRRFVACLGVVFCASWCATADDAEIKKTAKAKAEECQKALIRGDYEKLADLSHPKVVAAAGGRKKMIEGLAAETKKMKAEGVVFKSAAMADASDPIAVGKELYITIPFTLEIKVPDGRVTTKGALVGISDDGGKTWTFFDANPGALSRDALKKMFPDLPEKLPLPKKEPPTFTKD